MTIWNIQNIQNTFKTFKTFKTLRTLRTFRTKHYYAIMRYNIIGNIKSIYLMFVNLNFLPANFRNW